MSLKRFMVARRWCHHSRWGRLLGLAPLIAVRQSLVHHVRHCHAADLLQHQASCRSEALCRWPQYSQQLDLCCSGSQLQL